MSGVGLISAERLKLIPLKYHLKHEYCFHLHDYMVTVLKETERTGANRVRLSFKNKEEADKFETLAKDDAIEALKILGYSTEARKVMIASISVPLYADLLHFLHDGLIALEKRKFSVAFNLLRKPLKENLFFAAWLCGDTDSFETAFDASPDQSMSDRHLQPNKRKQILRSCIDSFDGNEFFDADTIYDMLYNKDHAPGLSNLFDKATHLVTSKNALLCTERQNLNFIFKNPDDNDVYDYVYINICYLLMFAMKVQYTLFSRFQPLENQFVLYSDMITVGCYDLIFGNGKSFLRFLQEIFGEFLDCPHCKQRIKLNRRSGASLLLVEGIHCTNCDNKFHFPLFWLFAKMDASGEVPPRVKPRI